MPRRNRALLPEVPCHITQRGVDRRETFSSPQDRLTYLRLLRENLSDAGARLLGFCLMTNHLHLVAVPAREDSLAVLLRRVHGRYAQYYNIRSGRSGHLWQNRFFACALDSDHLWAALAYTERNPVRAGLVSHAGEYRWSSAAAHLGGTDEFGVLDLDWWLHQDRRVEWAATLGVDDDEAAISLRRCTYSGQPYGSEDFVSSLSRRFGRYWKRGRPKADPLSVAVGIRDDCQLDFFAE
jgi:REP-associated tyrosine transposase